MLRDVLKPLLGITLPQAELARSASDPPPLLWDHHHHPNLYDHHHHPNLYDHHHHNHDHHPLAWGRACSICLRPAPFYSSFIIMLIIIINSRSSIRQSLLVACPGRWLNLYLYLKNTHCAIQSVFDGSMGEAMIAGLGGSICFSPSARFSLFVSRFPMNRMNTWVQGWEWW